MTDYSVQSMAGTGITPLFSSEKGDMSNRLNCAGAQIKNNIKALAEDTVVIGGTVAAGYAAKKIPGLAKVLAAPVQWFADGVKAICSKPFFQKVGNFISGMSKTNKAIALISLIGLSTLAYVGRKHAYKAGQIDQLYTDRAKLREKANINTL
ncbi:hypothetical protein IJS77_05595 [bacterium]|nr:hypothetical protein [bacterium]